MKRGLLPGLIGLLGLGIGVTLANDWPQWRGPERTGSSSETGLLKEWPKDGPKLLWEVTDIGNGYSTPVVVGNRLYVISNRDQEEYLLCLDTKDGKQVWQTKLGKVGPNTPLMPYPGSRSTPTVDGDFIYCLSSDGDLACCDAAKGEIKWQKQLRTDFAGEMGMWAYAESPLIDGDVLVCSPGGPKATMVALNKKTAEVIWKAEIPGGDQAAFSSPVVAQAGKVKQYVTFLSKGIVSVDAKTGRFLWRYDKTTDPAANIPTVLFHDNCVFSSTSRNSTALVKLEAKDDGTVAATEVYNTKEKLNSIGGEVLVGDFVYGTSQVELVCMEFKTGKVRWRDRCVGAASVCYADGSLYVRSHDTGTVALVEATPDRYKEKGRFEQPDRAQGPKGKAWPHPIVANGCLYLRDQNVLLCYDVKGK
jgi:outer membrane protein assembly factor BamB